MKLSKRTLAFTVLTCVGATNIDHTFGDPPRNLRSIFNERLQCTLYSSHSMPATPGVQGTETLGCVTDNEILYTVTNVPANFFAGNPFVSGSFRISVLNSCVSESGSIINLSEGDGQILASNLENRMARQKSVRSLIVMRVIDSRSIGPTLTRGDLADGIFGTAGDVLNLSSGYDNCSGGKQKFEPGVFDQAINGVMDLQLSVSTSGLSASQVETLARAAMDQVPGFNSGSYDHIMFVLDPTINLLAYAYINWKYSVFQDLWAARPSALIHELGHNLGYLHSGQGTDQYGDQSGLMGYSYSNDEGPIMCFNAAKSWYLNWYSNVDINPVNTNGNVELNLIGIDDYVNGVSDSTHTTVVKISGGSEDLYLMYNRRKGINSGTAEFRDTVNIVAQNGRTAQSWARAQLSTAGEYKVNDFGGIGGELVIKVCELVAGTPDIARTLIYHTNVTPMFCEGSNPTTAPVKNPTIAPVKSPTIAPVKSPTIAPVKSPTIAPVKSPTTAPVKNPTIAPVNSPTIAPVKNPTTAPVKTSDCIDDLSARFLFKARNNQIISKSCNWLEKNGKTAKLCSKKTKCTAMLPAAQVACPEICGFCGKCEQNPKGLFYFKTNKKGKPVYKNCSWLDTRSDRQNICGNNDLSTSSCQGLAFEVCPMTCVEVSDCSR